MLPEIKLNRDIVVIDDLQEFQEDEDLQKLNEIIRDNPQKKFDVAVARCCSQVCLGHFSILVI